MTGTYTPRSMPQRWIMLLILFLVRIAMGYQFQSVASLSPQLVNEFGFTYAEVGTLIGCFLLPGIIFSVPSGLMTRSATDKMLLILGAVVMIAGAVTMGFATGQAVLYVGRLITGFGGTIFSLILTKMVTEWFYKKEIITALAIMLAAWPLGLALGLLSHGMIAKTYGWAAVFHSTALVVAAGLVLVILFYRHAPQDAAGDKLPVRFGVPIRQFVHSSLVAVAWTLFNAVIIIMVSFGPDALIGAGHSSDPAHAVTSLMMWAMIISVPLGGRVIEMFGQVTVAIVGALLVSVGAILAISQGIAPEISFIVLGIFFGIPAGAIMSLTAETMTAEHRGPGLGLFYTWYYTGMTLAPAVAGWTRDVSGQITAPIMLAAVFCIIVIVSIALLRLLQTLWTIRTATV